MKVNTLNLLKSAYPLLTFKQKTGILFFTIIAFLGSFVEVISISSVLVFADIIFNDDQLNKYTILFNNYWPFKNITEDKIVTYISIVFIIVIVFSSIFKGLIMYIGHLISVKLTHFLNLKIFQSFTSFKFFLNKKNNISLVFSNLNKSHDFTLVVNNLMLMMSGTLMSIFIFSIMLVVDIKITLSVTIFIVFFYLIFILFFKNKVNTFSMVISENVNKRTNHVTNTANLLKYILLNNLKRYYFNDFKSIDYKIANKVILSALMASLPGIGVILVITILIISGVTYLKVTGYDINNELPKLTALVFSIQRIIPNLQQIYYGYTKSKSHVHQAYSIIDFIRKNIKLIDFDNKKKINTLKFEKNINLKNIKFFFKKNLIFNKANLKIKKNTRYVLIGPSGVGKSTLVDIMLGLLKPKSGSLSVDEKVINNSNLLSWNKNISFLNPTTYVFEGNFYENISLEKNPDQNIKQKIINCCKIAKIHDFIVKKGGYNSLLVHAGENLSTGQKQRIGIARALFRNPKLLIMDEATNSIDLKTEKSIFKNISKNNDLTILLISHKKEIPREFDEKIIIKNKKIFTYKI
jgi:ABC-type multidrug transport system fused ATPase/permease subunit